jgi:AcrR family transcriptional regulator
MSETHLLHQRNWYIARVTAAQVYEIDDAVLDAVARILERDGLGGLSISAIAIEANVSRVTLHRRGAGIDDFVVAVLGRASDDLQRSLWPALTGRGDARGRLEIALGVLCAVCERHAGVMAALYGIAARPLPNRPGRTTSLEFIEPFERLLRDGQLDGSWRSDDPRQDATLIANCVAWTYLHMRRAHGWPIATATARVIALALAGLQPPADVGE